MSEKRTALFQINYSRDTGEVRLLIETACGLRPVMGWPDVKTFQDFAVSLFQISNHIYRNQDDQEYFNEWLRE